MMREPSRAPTVRRVLGVLLVGMCAAWARETFAQQEPPSPADTSRYRLGPVGLNPRFALRDMGVDSNVFNTAEEPQEDFTLTMTSEIEAGMRVGRWLVSGVSGVDFVYFQEFSDQRTVNRRGSGRLALFLGRFRPYVSADTVEARERTGLEVDTRARHSQDAVTVGTDIQLTPVTSLVFSLRRSENTFDPTEEFRDVVLATELDQTFSTMRGGVAMALTPLTTLTAAVEIQQDSFSRTATRDSTTVRELAIVNFAPDAAVNGQASIGYRQFRLERPDVADFTGLVASGSLAYTMFDRTRFDVSFSRDVAYSFEPMLPYYLITGGSLAITQQLIGPLDVVVRGFRYRLEYRELGASSSDRFDTSSTVLGGVGIRLRPDIRVGVNAEAAHRRSTVQTHAEYDRTRWFGTFAYGF